MSAKDKKVVAGIDIGAGSGAKIGVFDIGLNLLVEGILPVSKYGSGVDTLVVRASGVVRDLLDELDSVQLVAVGIASPGTVTADGAIRNAINIPMLAGVDLVGMFSANLNVPVALANDGDAGALAEWHSERVELLYWVFGGGWGGAWISAEGAIRFSSAGWDGDESQLHYADEPGFATPIPKETVEEILNVGGLSLKDFEKRYMEDLGEDGPLLGPAGRDDCVRAELLVSGAGRWRIFREFALRDDSYKAGLSEEENRDLWDPAVAGKVIDKLGKAGVGVAVQTDRLFGIALAEAASIILVQAEDSGCPSDVPIFLAGKPSRAISLFGPTLTKELHARGIVNRLRLSRVEESGRNPNMVGAGVIATRLLEH